MILNNTYYGVRLILKEWEVFAVGKRKRLLFKAISKERLIRNKPDISKSDLKAKHYCQYVYCPNKHKRHKIKDMYILGSMFFCKQYDCFERFKQLNADK